MQEGVVVGDVFFGYRAYIADEVGGAVHERVGTDLAYVDIHAGKLQHVQFDQRHFLPGEVFFYQFGHGSGGNARIIERLELLFVQRHQFVQGVERGAEGLLADAAIVDEQAVVLLVYGHGLAEAVDDHAAFGRDQLQFDAVVFRKRGVFVRGG